jgi:hypothetical protein
MSQLMRANGNRRRNRLTVGSAWMTSPSELGLTTNRFTLGWKVGG